MGQGDKVTPQRGFSLAFTYVQGMALTYAAAGAIFVLAFKQAPQAFFQQPWIIILFALLFVALALAMFGTYTLQLPSALQTRLTDVSNQQKSGTYVGTFVMGALSALVVTACVAPAIIAALSVISQSRQIARGAGALYATGLGMGVPLLIVGASAGSLLPQVGPWMDTIKQLFGVLFLGVAIYLLQPLLPDALIMLLWSALAIVSGFWIFSLKARDGGPALAPVRATGPARAGLWRLILLIGAASGSHDPLQPLDTLRAQRSGGSATAGHELKFQRIKSDCRSGARSRRCQRRRQAGDARFLCRLVRVLQGNGEVHLHRPRPCRRRWRMPCCCRPTSPPTTTQDKALLARFEIFGPPTIAFFGADGVERKNFRLVGFTPADRFRDHVSRSLCRDLTMKSADRLT